MAAAPRGGVALLAPFAIVLLLAAIFLLRVGLLAVLAAPSGGEPVGLVGGAPAPAGGELVAPGRGASAPAGSDFCGYADSPPLALALAGTAGARAGARAGAPLPPAGEDLLSMNVPEDEDLQPAGSAAAAGSAGAVAGIALGGGAVADGAGAAGAGRFTHDRNGTGRRTDESEGDDGSAFMPTYASTGVVLRDTDGFGRFVRARNACLLPAASHEPFNTLNGAPVPSVEDLFEFVNEMVRNELRPATNFSFIQRYGGESSSGRSRLCAHASGAAGTGAVAMT